MSFNLARLAEPERLRIELDKQAAHLIWLGRQGRISREEVMLAIARQPAQHQPYFRDRLNYYREA